ncbi:MAG TPA: Uma2 family endonuclease [Gemmatimonadaceae bacterium]|nr:Uma2 family endonuclease [Gemmatimonadaceae bacterium]
MAMPFAELDWTAQMVRDLPDDGQRHEVVDGEHLVTPAPRLLHQRAIAHLFRELAPYVDAHGLGEPLMSPADVAYGPRTLVQPDLFVIPLLGARRARDWKELPPLTLAVEVISPSSARGDRIVKRKLFQREGIPEYWIVDLDARLVERWRPVDARPEVLAEALNWQPRPDVPPLELDLVGYFGDVLDA